MTQDPPAYRSLSDNLLKALEVLVDEQQGGWWRDVLAHPDLILAVRREALNVYYRGASLFRIGFKHGRLAPETHVEYLVRQRQALATLDQTGIFDIAPPTVLWQTYEGPQTLTEIMAAAALAGPEKSGLRSLIQASQNVVDVAETGLPQLKAAPFRQDRLDVASLETRADPAKAWLVFHEAKHFSNPALRG